MTQPPACPNFHMIRRLEAGELFETEEQQLEQHILTCSACGDELDALQSANPFTNKLQIASSETLVEDAASSELIERLVRTPLELVDPARFNLEARAAASRRELVLKARLAQDHDVLALDEALDRLQAVDDEAARLVQLRHFGGLSGDDAADILGIDPRAASRLWAFARAWLHREMQSGSRQF